MNDTSTVFEFERDFSATLRCIPMAVRFKLDHCGVKLSLRQWSRFQLDERDRLLRLPCGTPQEITHYKEAVVALIAARTGDAVKEIDVPASPEWSDGGRLPAQVLQQAAALGLAPPTLAQWQALDPLRRFVLLKLSRQSHDNLNFGPALREFGLLPGGPV